MPNVAWVMGTDRDLPVLGSLPGAPALAAVTIANAIHLTSGEDLFTAALGVLRPGGALAVIANGTPRWQQPAPGHGRFATPWNSGWLDARLASCCGTDTASREGYQAAMPRPASPAFMNGPSTTPPVSASRN